VVLMHQTPLSINEFAGVMPLLAAKHRVIAIDMPGYGCSDRPAKQPQIRDYAEAVRAVLDGLQIDKAHFVGHHTGTLLAVELAGLYPGRVASLVLSGPHYLDEKARRELDDVSVQWHVKPDGSHLQEKWNKLDAWISDPQVLHQVVIDIMWAGETSEYGHFAGSQYRMEDRLPLVKGPALIVVGTNDPFTSEESAGVFAKAIQPSRTVVLDGGVFLPSEQPETFAKIVLEYLEER
jgi:pimeloyl-ACP methyl ester carboxylesterase